MKINKTYVVEIFQTAVRKDQLRKHKGLCAVSELFKGLKNINK